jgi:cytochrome c
MKRWIMAMGLGVASVAGAVQAADLCKVNPYTKAEATQGKALFDSHCALCHQYDMAGRQPGNHKNESPDINLLADGDVTFLDNAGGVVPPLIGREFFKRTQTKYASVAEWSSMVSGAAITFPPSGTIDTPYTYLKIAAYVLYRNCGKKF